MTRLQTSDTASVIEIVNAVDCPYTCCDDVMSVTSNNAMQLVSNNEVGFRIGPVMQVGCHTNNNIANVELSSPPSLHHLVSDETRHSDTRDVSRECNPTAAFDTNELVMSRSEEANNDHLRPKRARSEGSTEPHNIPVKRQRRQQGGIIDASPTGYKTKPG